MVKQIDIKNIETAKKVLQMQRDSYMVEAEWIGSTDIPPLKESLEELLSCGEQFIGYFEGEDLAGALAFKTNSTEVDIHRVMVHPNHFRKGIAKKLIQYIENLHHDKDMIVSTGAKNTPAIQLYLGLGFTKVGEIEVGNGIVISNFKKQR
ncbi:GNAT family N-acetyltransferase [Bacillus sp. 31A1R]|uniref:GNAT family N-acetyltransferase n=1 Tax=Robertmurraya mangrovi TaxID=3098077 RepID=A0ABU5J285_9BACI|nr:GNAT family N-acetyltransferase [Bacillus sp. 31A1R]MDZ5473514.1 GNAT family N-acetyltransferase [Bacillus sp. 31A1R]